MDLGEALDPNGAAWAGGETAPPPLVVAAMAPAQILVPWAAKASAAVVMFLAGQATGEAWANGLLGEGSPSGKLPVTLAVSEEGTLAPCDEPTCVYDDRLSVGWKRCDEMISPR